MNFLPSCLFLSPPLPKQQEDKEWPYSEAGSYPGEINIDSPEDLHTTLTITADPGKGSTIHLILEARDSGKPSLRRFQRVVINVI